MRSSDSEGLLLDLFDFSFSRFVVLRVIKLVFAVLLILDAGFCVGLIGKAFGAGLGWGIVVLLVSPLLFIIIAVFARIFTEIMVVLFRIAEHTSILARPKGGEEL